MARFIDRIEAEIRRGDIASAEDEERNQLERWLIVGVDTDETWSMEPED